MKAEEELPLEKTILDLMDQWPDLASRSSLCHSIRSCHARQPFTASQKYRRSWRLNALQKGSKTSIVIETEDFFSDCSSATPASLLLIKERQRYAGLRVAAHRAKKSACLEDHEDRKKPGRSTVPQVKEDKDLRPVTFESSDSWTVHCPLVSDTLPTF